MQEEFTSNEKRVKPANRMRRIAPVVLILFILAIISTAVAYGVARLNRSALPENTLLYVDGDVVIGDITYGDRTEINEDGAVVLDLFDAQYQNVASEDGGNVVAPGVDKLSTVSLMNTTSREVIFYATLYQIKTDEDLTVIPYLDGEGMEDSEVFFLPDNVYREQIIRTVRGTIDRDAVQDFDVTWYWEYFVDNKQDRVDTALGNETDLDETAVGLYITVVDNNCYIVPQYGEASHYADVSQFGMWIVLIALGFGAAIVLAWEHYKKKKQQAKTALQSETLTAEAEETAQTQEETNKVNETEEVENKECEE